MIIPLDSDSGLCSITMLFNCLNRIQQTSNEITLVNSKPSSIEVFITGSQQGSCFIEDTYNAFSHRVGRL